MDIVSKRRCSGGEELSPRPCAVRLLLSGALICASFGHSVDGVARIVEPGNGSAAIFKGTQTRGHGPRESHASVFNSNSWCDPFKTWQHAYSFDPLKNVTADQAKLILGGKSRIDLTVLDYSHVNVSFVRSTSPLDRTIRPSEPRSHYLAPCCIFR